MIKKIILSALVFISAFAISILIFMPYTELVSKIVDDIVKKQKIDVRYETLDVGLFGSSITKLATGDLVINKLIIKYNPIGLLFKNLFFTADSPLFMADGELSGNELTANIKGSLASVAKMAGFDGGGSLDAKIKYDITKNEGSADIKSGPVSFIHPLMKIEADNFDASATIKNNIVNISKAQAKGKTTLDASGTITLNNKKIEHSSMDISGKAGLMGMNMDFRLSGSFLAPRFSTK